MTAHTEGKLRVVLTGGTPGIQRNTHSLFVTSDGGAHVCDIATHRKHEAFSEAEQANARRIVAAWNACLLIETDALERTEFPPMRINDANHFDAFSRMRRNLLVALAEAKDYIEAVARKEPGTDRAKLYSAGAERLRVVMADAGWRE